MKIKGLIIILFIGFFSTVSFAQEQNFEIQISLNEPMIWRNSENAPVKVKITNKSKTEMQTSQLQGIYFYISRCSKMENCFDLFNAGIKIPSENLMENDSLEFEVNLADLYWQDVNSGFIDTKLPKNLEAVPYSNNHFYAEIKVLDNQDIEDESAKLKVKRYKTFASNEVVLKMQLKK